MLDNLFHSNCKDLDIIIDQDTGEAYATIETIAQIAETEFEEISYWAGFINTASFESEIEQVDGTTKIKSFYSESVIVEAIASKSAAILKDIARTGIKYFLYSLAEFDDLEKEEEHPSELAERAIMAIDLILSKLNISEEELAQYKLNAVKELDPAIAAALDPLQLSLLKKKDFALLTIQEIAERIGISKNAVSKKLIELGFLQECTDSNVKNLFVVSGKGCEFAEVIQKEGNLPTIKWYESILNFFQACT